MGESCGIFLEAHIAFSHQWLYSRVRTKTMQEKSIRHWIRVCPLTQVQTDIHDLPWSSWSGVPFSFPKATPQNQVSCVDAELFSIKQFLSVHTNFSLLSSDIYTTNKLLMHKDIPKYCTEKLELWKCVTWDAAESDGSKRACSVLGLCVFISVTLLLVHKLLETETRSGFTTLSPMLTTGGSSLNVLNEFLGIDSWKLL